MKIIYESTFNSIGLSAKESLADDFIITFGEGAPADVAEYCFIHTSTVNNAENITVGSKVSIGSNLYSITSVGDVARENLRDLGHITIRFDGAKNAEFPGTIHVSGKTPSQVELGTKFMILGD